MRGAGKECSPGIFIIQSIGYETFSGLLVFLLRRACLHAHPPTLRSSPYVSIRVGTEICTRQLLGNNTVLPHSMVLNQSPLLSPVANRLRAR